MQTHFRFTRVLRILAVMVLQAGIIFSTFAGVTLPTLRASEEATSSSSQQVLHLWSPASNVVLYWSLNAQQGGPGLLPYDLNLYNAETGQHYTLAQDGYGGIAKFSRDGSTISFWYDNAPYLVRVGSDDISTSKIYTEAIPVKGTFSSNHENLIYTTETNEVRVRNLTTDREQSLGSFENISTLPYLSPEWSPADQWVAFGTETQGILIDPSGVEEPVLLANWISPESEFSSATHFFTWSDDGSSLYDYSGRLIYTSTADAVPAPSLERDNMSHDGSFEILYVDGELFLENVVAGTRKQLTTNSNTIEELLRQESAAQPSPDVSTLAVATGFDYPVGKPNGTGYNTTAGCWWLQRDGACAPGPHPGQDFNGNGGGDSDLGHPVYAVANGNVVYSGVGSGTSWGNIIMIEHTLPDGSKVWSQYAHLQNRNVSSGTVNKGDQIGTIGKGYNNIFYAHLHFEIRIQYRAADAWITGWSDDQVRQYYAKPDDYINSHRNIDTGTDCNDISGTGIKLFDSVNCNGAEKAVSQTGFTNLPDFNDRAESIYVSSGWSVKVYEHNDRGGSSRCIDHSMWDLSKDYYTSGDTGKTIQNDISSIEVFSNSSCTGGSPPSIPSNFRISSSTQTSITIAWDDVSNESGYNIYEWNGSDFVFLASVGANSTSFTETRGECGWDEFYQVSAHNAYGESGRADWKRGYTKPCNPTLYSPGNNSSNPHNYDLTFEWDYTPGATEYLLEWWGGPYSTMQPCGWSSSTSCHVGNVIPGNTYSWHVKARNSAGESNWSDTWTFTIQSNLVPDLVVQSITVSPSSPTINQSVSFTVRIKNQGIGNIDSSFYVDLYLDRQPITDCSDTGSIWWKVENLAAGATLDLTNSFDGFSDGGAHSLHAFADTNCYIAESNESNNILGPQSINVQQIQPPPAPSLTSPTNGSSNPYNYDLTFQWNSSTGATEYLIEWWGGPYSTMQPCGWSNSTFCHIGSVIPGNTYSWHVKARNTSGESNWSPTWTFTVRQELPGIFNKTGPANAATGLPTNPTLTWTVSNGATSYQYCYDTTNDNACSIWTSTGTSTSATLSGLNAATTYYWHVRAINSGGTRYSENSSTAFRSFKTRGPTVKMTVAATVDDGWVLESSELSNKGGTMNASATTLAVGDAAADKQYRSILSFNTAGLPDNAVITRVTFRVMHHSVAGTNPFSTHGNIVMDIFKGASGGNNALQLTDFQAVASKNAVATITNTPSANWYAKILGTVAHPYVNKSGVTQFRLRFNLDDNDDLTADLLRLYSGNATAAYRPRLIIEYYLP